MTTEIPLRFDCEGASLVGMLHRPGSASRRGVLIVVGGPQYRIGSHRQFLLLARALAEAGIPAMRFDYRGMGDSDGEFQGFENIGEDIACAVDAFFDAQPGMEEVVLWGLCDAASAILFYAPGDARVAGAVLLNPWVRSESGYAKTQLKHYYLQRVASRELWSKILRGRFDIAGSLASFVGIVRKAASQGKDERNGGDAPPGGGSNPLAERMATGFRRFGKPVLLVMSGNDLTAREFDDAANASAAWREAFASGRLVRRDLAAADHTFSRRAWRDEVAAWTREWIASL